MLDPWIIDEIRRREEQRRERDARHLELPLYEEPIEDVAKEKDDNEPKRGVVVMDI